jgi:hypothetical protein
MWVIDLFKFDPSLFVDDEDAVSENEYEVKEGLAEGEEEKEVGGPEGDLGEFNPDEGGDAEGIIIDIIPQTQ